jgi:hypothetical protein
MFYKGFCKNSKTRVDIIVVQTTTLDFADDTLIISDAHQQILKAVDKILQDYAEITGLKMNLQKMSLFL